MPERAELSDAQKRERLARALYMTRNLLVGDDEETRIGEPEYQDHCSTHVAAAINQLVIANEWEAACYVYIIHQLHGLHLGRNARDQRIFFEEAIKLGHELNEPDETEAIRWIGFICLIERND